MRVLILSALLACASAAPLQPLSIIAIAPVVPAAIPTLSPGDLQAAAINAKVKAEDEARALADQARLAADIARDRATVALEDQKTQPAPPAAEMDAKVKADNEARFLADQEQLAAVIDAKVKDEDEARRLADQAQLAADIARERAELALENQKPQPALPTADADAKVKAEATARYLVDQEQLAADIDAKVRAEDEARRLADQARLAADIAREQAELALANQKIAPTPPAAEMDAEVKANNEARFLADQAQLAADIDAKIKAEDAARMLADQARLAADIAREQAELALENQKEKTEEVNSIAKEKSEDLFWNVEDKKWQAIDAVKTVEAKLDGAVAGNADALVKSLTYPIVAPVSLPYANLVYTPGLISLAGVKDEKLVKNAEPEDSKDKLGQPKLEGLALAQAPISYLGAPWVQAPLTLYQPGVLQPVLTTVIKQW